MTDIAQLMQEARRLQAGVEPHRNDGEDYLRWEAWCTFAHVNLRYFLDEIDRLARLVGVCPDCMNLTLEEWRDLRGAGHDHP